MRNLILATAAALALSATGVQPAETLGDPAAWGNQWNACRADPTHVERVVYAPGDQWLNECTVSRGPVRYRMVTVTRWFIPIDQHACVLSGGLATCRDYWTGLFTCFADYGRPDPFLWPAICTPEHWSLWQPAPPPPLPPPPPEPR